MQAHNLPEYSSEGMPGPVWDEVSAWSMLGFVYLCVWLLTLPVVAIPTVLELVATCGGWGGLKATPEFLVGRYAGKPVIIFKSWTDKWESPPGIKMLIVVTKSLVVRSDLCVVELGRWGAISREDLWLDILDP